MAVDPNGKYVYITGEFRGQRTNSIGGTEGQVKLWREQNLTGGSDWYEDEYYREPKRPKNESYTFNTTPGTTTQPSTAPSRTFSGGGSGGGGGSRTGVGASATSPNSPKSLSALASLLGGGAANVGTVGNVGGGGSLPIGSEPPIEPIEPQLTGSETSAGHVALSAPGAGRGGIGQRIPPSLAALLKVKVY